MINELHNTFSVEKTQDNTRLFHFRRMSNHEIIEKANMKAEGHSFSNDQMISSFSRPPEYYIYIIKSSEIDIQKPQQQQKSVFCYASKFLGDITLFF